MKGSYEIKVSNARLSYKFTINRNITILRGDSATGKTTLIDMLLSYQNNGPDSGVDVQSPKPCVVLTQPNWQIILRSINDSIVFIDEGCAFVSDHEFARMIQESSNYYVIATRTSLFNLPYSIQEVYGIKNTSGNRYQGTKRLYSEFYPLHSEQPSIIENPDCVIVEDSNSGYEFFRAVFQKNGIPCFSAEGKSKIFEAVLRSNFKNILVIADGAAFGAEMNRVLSLRQVKNVILFLPESFEWLILKSDLLKNIDVRKILNSPSDYIDSELFFSWERYFSRLLVEESNGTYLHYSKSELNPVYLQPHEASAIMANIPPIKVKESTTE